LAEQGAIVDRAAKFGMRNLRIQGGYNLPVILVRRNVSGGDPSRGVRGVVGNYETELKPRPNVRHVRANDITRVSSKLQMGDVIIELTQQQVSETDLQDQNLRIRLGYPPAGELLNVVSYELQTLAGSVVTYLVYARGIVNT
jgi:hypothetical protein